MVKHFGKDRRMTKEELIKKLEECKKLDTEGGHIEADDLLLEYIDDDEVRKVFNEISKWYA